MIQIDLSEYAFPKEIAEFVKKGISPKIDSINLTESRLAEIEDEIWELQDERSTLETLYEKEEKELKESLHSIAEKIAFWSFLGMDSGIVTSIIYGPDRLTLNLFD